MSYSRIEIDEKLCIGSGTCIGDAPDAFELRGSGLAVPKLGATELPDDRLIRIAQNCPVGAIVLYDQEDNEVDVFGGA